MSLSAPALGGLFGVGFVLLLGFVVQRSNSRQQQRRLDLIRQRIERRQAALNGSARRQSRSDESTAATERHEHG